MLYDTMRVEERLILKELKDLGANVALINIDNISLSLNNSGDFGIVLVRPMSHSKAGLVARILNIHGVRTINKGLAIENSWNKAIAISTLARAGIPTVPTRLILSINAQGDGVSYPAIVKPIHGSWGRLVSLVGNAEDLAMIMRHKAVGDSYSRIAMIQPFIGDGTDYRVFVIGDEVAASMVRKPGPGDWRSNVARGGIAHAVKLSADAYEIAIKAVKALDLDYAGVDLLYSEEGGYMVNEVNAIPEFKGLMSVSGVNIARKIAEYVINTARR
ncbi:ATP-grasp domain-containing protein [Vulcanisaeta distributa]|uniref:Alpha-L-glutamate ligase, RimK family n=1 Tax=Vulcanisaeta distributa (strain DSM 14429 / JCM 11212 / NBRC 100878 / IC-017) TaxID=572478 RepID=E1QSU2_VULDI|nr:RimK family alpha-L-glutamate ligase [Vulcanisaeta distributa]ADN49609.1 alpha-L-glutamate ligase, RimK family [Vulcanisaeta distributa DSM 14429]